MKNDILYSRTSDTLTADYAYDAVELTLNCGIRFRMVLEKISPTKRKVGGPPLPKKRERVEGVKQCYNLKKRAGSKRSKFTREFKEHIVWRWKEKKERVIYLATLCGCKPETIYGWTSQDKIEPVNHSIPGHSNPEGGLE